MPTLPWTTVNTASDPAGACTVFAAQLRLRRYRQMPRLLWLTLRIRRQLAHTPGLLGYAFDLEIRQRTLWTSSAWTRRTALARFERGYPHQSAKLALRSAILPPAFAVWTCPIDRLPVPWRETHDRIRANSNRV